MVVYIEMMKGFSFIQITDIDKPMLLHHCNTKGGEHCARTTVSLEK
jgi:hypothetical protein